ncbi:MAG: FKBP-type peptidyl-prolyl cis-trans isomerase [Candidatus Pacebacteria bacterium]|nr:FKBP-type peptidyl-prolyl cis-trans isomerase [Candidatus Paceibacterota bacterium]
MKKLLIIFLIVAAGLVYYFGFYQAEEQPADENYTQIANPAAVYCEEQGGTSEGVMFEDGIRSYCVFDDGSKCWQWDFYRGYCEKGELKIEVLEEGEGNRATVGDTVLVHYVGTLAEDGTQFDSSLGGSPYSLTLGEGRVIAGWEYGLLGMKAGEKRRLTIGSGLGYGEAGYPGVIPGNATLIFEVEIMEIR